MVSLPDQCYATRSETGFRDNQVRYFGWRPRAYKRQRNRFGLWVWRAEQWLGEASSTRQEAIDAGAKSGLPYIDKATNHGLAMHPSEFASAEEQAAIRLGWWKVREIGKQWLAVVVEDNEIVRFGPFPNYYRMVRWEVEIKHMLSGLRDPVVTATQGVR